MRILLSLLILVLFPIGWMDLTKKFPLQTGFAGKLERFQTGSMGRKLIGHVEFGSCLAIGMVPEGLFLKLMWPFSIGNPPLLIPWKEIRKITVKRFLLGGYDLLELGDPKITTLALPKKHLEQACRYIQA